MNKHSAPLAKYLALISKNIDLITSLRNDLQATIVEDVLQKKGYYALKDMELIEAINLLIENTETVNILTKNGLAFQAQSILRNSTEILIRVVIQAVHYQWVKFEPSKREGFDIASKAEIMQFLQKNGVKGKNGKTNVENAAFDFLIKMFPHKENPFFNLVNQLQKIYGVLCSYSHPEQQLQSRLNFAMTDSKKNENGQTLFTAALIGGERRRIYEQDEGNFKYLFELNLLTVRIILELFRGIISKENHEKNITNIHRAFYEFHRPVDVEDQKKKIEEYKKKTQAKRFLTMRLKEAPYPWPKKITEINLFDRTWLLWPRTEEDMPAIIIPCINEGREEELLVMRFLSAMSWVYDTKIDHEGFWSSGNGISSCKRNPPHHPIYQPFFAREFLLDEHDYLPLPEDEKTQLALALYREGQCLDNDNYKFLSFFKILNLISNDWKQQVSWINNNINKIKDHRAKEVFADLQKQHNDVGNYLYTSGRCAVAHAFDLKCVVHPDNPDDIRRLNTELPLIKALSELLIEQEFKVQSRHTVYDEHLYELAGFRKKIGEEIINAFPKITADTPDQDFKELLSKIDSKLPPLSIRIRGCKIRPFENFKPTAVGCGDKKIVLSCKSESLPIEVLIGLNFGDERLEFYLPDGFLAKDDQSPEMAKAISDMIRFKSNLLSNGVFEVWEFNGPLLGRKDEYIPVNVDLGRTSKKWNEIADQYDKVFNERTATVDKKDK